jgi:hypothetical protein
MDNIKFVIRDGVQATYEVFAFTNGKPDDDRPMGSGNSPDEALGHALREMDLAGSFTVAGSVRRVITLEIDYKHDDNASLTEERWVFTEDELENPAACDRDDEFLASGSGLPEVGILVQRNGEVTNRYGDGTAGVPDEQRTLVNDAETLGGMGEYNLGDIADNWRQVMVDDRGRFHSWVKEG